MDTQLLDDIPVIGQPILLGVLGHRQDITYDILHEQIINPILAEIGRIPDRVVLPSESTSSALLYGWAEKLKLSMIAYETDWNRLGRKARAIRDARIAQESTHLILFLGKRSDYYDNQALTLARKGKIVFTVSNEFELEQVVIEKPPQQEQEKPLKPKTPKQSSTRGAQRPSSRRQQSSSCPQTPPSSPHQPSLASWLQQRSPPSSS